MAVTTRHWPRIIAAGRHFPTRNASSGRRTTTTTFSTPRQQQHKKRKRCTQYTKGQWWRAAIGGSIQTQYALTSHHVTPIVDTV